MRNFFLFVISSCLMLAGCATYSQMFINAEGQIMRCSSTGQGMIGMMVAQGAESSCEHDLRAAGYIPLYDAGVIGITLVTTRTDSAEILSVKKDSPADSAGVVAHDKIIMVDSIAVTNYIDTQHLLFGHAYTTVKLTILRGADRKELLLTRMPYTELYGNP